jgi:hypothetical protein
MDEAATGSQGCRSTNAKQKVRVILPPATSDFQQRLAPGVDTDPETWAIPANAYQRCPCPTGLLVLGER